MLFLVVAISANVNPNMKRKKMKSLRRKRVYEYDYSQTYCCDDTENILPPYKTVTVYNSKSNNKVSSYMVLKPIDQCCPFDDKTVRCCFCN